MGLPSGSPWLQHPLRLIARHTQTDIPAVQTVIIIIVRHHHHRTAPVIREILARRHELFAGVPLALCPEKLRCTLAMVRMRSPSISSPPSSYRTGDQPRQRKGSRRRGAGRRLVFFQRSRGGAGRGGLCSSKGVGGGTRKACLRCGVATHFERRHVTGPRRECNTRSRHRGGALPGEAAKAEVRGKQPKQQCSMNGRGGGARADLLDDVSLHPSRFPCVDFLSLVQHRHVRCTPPPHELHLAVPRVEHVGDHSVHAIPTGSGAVNVSKQASRGEIGRPHCKIAPEAFFTSNESSVSSLNETTKACGHHSSLIMPRHFGVGRSVRVKDPSDD